MDIYWIRAQAPRRTLALARHLGIEANFIDMTAEGRSLKSPDFARLNPNMQAPALVDNEVILWESAAINAYLSAKAGSDLWPSDTMEQVDVLRWISWNNRHWESAIGDYYFEYIVKPTFRLAETDPSRLEGKDVNVLKHGRVLNDHLRGRDFVAGRLTIADFQLASMACYWKRAQMPFDGFPDLTAWLNRLHAMPAWASPWPDREGDAFID